MWSQSVLASQNIWSEGLRTLDSQSVTAMEIDSSGNLSAMDSNYSMEYDTMDVSHEEEELLRKFQLYLSKATQKNKFVQCA